MIQYKYLTYYQLYVVKSNYSRKGKRNTGGVHFMDSKAFFKLSYGVYIISTSADNKEGGCVINTLTQVTSSPARLSIALNKENYTLKLIETSGTFSAAVLSDDVEMDLIRRFGFQCGKARHGGFGFQDLFQLLVFRAGQYPQRHPAEICGQLLLIRMRDRLRTSGSAGCQKDKQQRRTHQSSHRKPLFFPERRRRMEDHAHSTCAA